MSDVRERIAVVLRSGLEADALTRELEPLAKESDFGEAADLWAPALYERDPRYFAPFLARHLGASEATVIRTLLPQIETAGQEDLFVALYRNAVDEAGWNDDLRAISTTATDAELTRAVNLRSEVPSSFVLGEDLAAALYRRIPAAFAAMLLPHVLPGYDWTASRNRTYQELRTTARANGDDAVIWRLFRAFADTQEWTIEMTRLAVQNVPAEAITTELAKRQLDQTYNMDPAVLVTFLDRYGTTLTPFVDANLEWIGRLQTDLLLEAIQRIGDVGLFRRVFFRFADNAAWNAALTRAIAAQNDDAALERTLREWAPPVQQLSPRTWQLDGSAARTLYARDAARFRPFILLTTLQAPEPALFDAANANGDEDLLDALTYAVLDELATTVSTTFPNQKAVSASRFRGRQADWLREWTARICDRFDRLHAAAPTTYTQHAARILSRDLGSAIKLRDDDERNPVAYLYQQHRAAWAQDPTAIATLIETPDTATQEWGLTFLSAGDAEAAARTTEVLPTLLALLVGDAPRSLKKLALRCLESAAAANPAAAAQIAPRLEEVMYYQSATNLDERVMVSFVRARRYAQAQLVGA